MRLKKPHLLVLLPVRNDIRELQKAWEEMLKNGVDYTLSSHINLQNKEIELGQDLALGFIKTIP